MPLLNTADAVYLGATAVDKVYLGTNEVWPAAAATYADEVSADSPFAWWRFGETSGSTVSDEIGSNDGTVFGANLATAGQQGSAVSFDGTDDYIDVGTLGTFGSSFSEGVTVELFCKFTTTSRQWMWGQFNSGNSVIFGLLCNDNNALAGSVNVYWRSGNGIVRARATSVAVNDGSWHHIVGTLSGLNAEWDVYVDGSLSNGFLNQGLGPASDADLDRALTLGAENTGSKVGHHAGSMDEVALYTSVLSSARILAHAQAAGVA